ncbi:MAG: hypothetical protein KDE23_22380, partial [Caldilinea sp.]|nr:hypothetical protein [Caldilinea sp.]
MSNFETIAISGYDDDSETKGVHVLADKKVAYARRYVGYIDLSAKLEQWTKDSVIVLSNGEF